MKRFALLLVLLYTLSPCRTVAATISLVWDASITPTVTGYRLYYGLASRVYTTNINVGNVQSYTIDASFLSNVPYYFAATAYDGDGGESGYSNEVEYIFVSEPVPPSSNVAAYAFDEGSGAVVNDLSGAANNGTLIGTWSTGHTNTAVAFNGTSQYVTIADNATLDLGNSGTVEMWMLLNALNRWHGLIAKGTANSDAAHAYAIEVTNSNVVQCILGNGNSATVVPSTAALPLTTWVHVACVWSATILQLYVNGVAVASGTSLTPVVNSAPLEIGRFGQGFDYMNGKVDDVRVYNRALTLAEVTHDMATPVSAQVQNATNLQLTFTP